MAPHPSPRTAGADAGASLIKLALRGARGELSLECFETVQQAVGRLRNWAPDRVGLTGCGAARLAAVTPGALIVEEFEAWASGARFRLGETYAGEPFLLVSIGTGTSALRVTRQDARRVGGTSLGGGTLLGLAAVLLGTRDFAEIASLASRGDRSRVDLTVGDIYGDDFELPAFFTAASFAKLQPGSPVDPADLAQALMGLLGENVGRTCALLAEKHGAESVAFGGTCLRGNPYLANLLRGMCLAAQLPARVLDQGEYTGALGALQLAEASPI